MEVGGGGGEDNNSWTGTIAARIGLTWRNGIIMQFATQNHLGLHALLNNMSAVLPSNLGICFRVTNLTDLIH